MDPVCASFPDTSGILLVMKTGASEAYKRLPTQLMTALKCLPDFLIFSDMDQHIAGYHIYDSLDTVLFEAKDGNSDFDLYRRQRACAVDLESCNKQGDPASEGWNLDKYKNTHMAEKTYQLRPGYRWYIFVDADTYVVWPNLVQWLGTMNPDRKLFLGSVSLINDFPFAHGGSGYILSHAALKAYAGDNPGIANKFDMAVRQECCGDFLFSKSLKETTNTDISNMVSSLLCPLVLDTHAPDPLHLLPHESLDAFVEVMEAPLTSCLLAQWPTINGEKPYTLPFKWDHWCQPVVTMHHMNSEEISTFWDWERRRYDAQAKPTALPPLLLRDVYREFVEPKLRKQRRDWDNLSDDTFYLDKDTHKGDWRVDRLKKEDDMNEFEEKAHLSAEHCAAACDSVGTNNCFQWLWVDSVCAFANSFKLGAPVKVEGDVRKRMISGWMIDKIKKLADERECDVTWPSP